MVRENISQSPLVNGGVYHVISRSIARYQIFNTNADYLRMVQVLRFYQIAQPVTKYSMFLRLKGTEELGFDSYFSFLHKDQEKLTDIVAYCLMPNHIHLILKQLKKKGISIFMANVLNSYTRYFNILHKRKGPLWDSRFKHILVSIDDQLLHLTRYIHLNPCSAKLCERPENWKYSSYLEYVDQNRSNIITSYKDLLQFTSREYRRFVNDQKDYQRKLSEIKNLVDLET